MSGSWASFKWGLASYNVVQQQGFLPFECGMCDGAALALFYTCPYFSTDLVKSFYFSKIFVDILCVMGPSALWPTFAATLIVKSQQMQIYSWCCSFSHMFCIRLTLKKNSWHQSQRRYLKWIVVILYLWVGYFYRAGVHLELLIHRVLNLKMPNLERNKLLVNGQLMTQM